MLYNLKTNSLVKFICIRSKKAFELLNKTIGELLRAVTDLYQNVTKTLNDLFKQVYDAYHSRILPSLKESYNQIAEALGNFYDELVSSAMELLNRVVESLKKFEDDFKKIAKSVSDWFNKLSKLLNEGMTKLHKELLELRKLVSDLIRSLPGLETLKERIDSVRTFVFLAQFLCFSRILYAEWEDANYNICYFHICSN